MGLFVESDKDPQKVDKFYEQMTGEAYEDFLVRINFTDPYKVAEAICKPAPAGGEEGFGFLDLARDATIFDIGCGPGILARLLTAQGFTTIDGADCAPNFIEDAKQSGHYKDVREMWFGKGPDQLPADLKNKYDLVMGTGIFMDGHISAAGFDEAHAMLKTGGHFITAIRSYYYVDGHEYGYKERIQQLVDSGRWEIIKTWTFMRGIAGAEDPLFREMPSFMFVCKRLD